MKTKGRDLMAAVIFDMDGVLVDSEAMYQYELRKFFREQGQRVTRQQVSAFVGCSDDFFYRHMGELWEPKRSPQQMRQFYETHNRFQEIDYRSALNPHVRYILSQIKKCGMQTAIASSSRRESIERMLTSNELNAYFDEIVSGHEVPRSKPDPAIYHEVVRRLGVTSKQCIVIEDSTIGIEAAKRAGMYVIAKREIRFSVDQRQADVIADDLLQAWEHIQEHFHLAEDR